jgi:hypothetical protein
MVLTSKQPCLSQLFLNNKNLLIFLESGESKIKSLVDSVSGEDFPFASNMGLSMYPQVAGGMRQVSYKNTISIHDGGRPQIINHFPKGPHFLIFYIEC